jgi:PEP-CTERM motif
MKHLLTMCILVPLVCAVGSATTIYNNGSPNQASADELSDVLVAEDFPVASAATLTNLEFWDIEGPSAYNGSISWFLYNSVAGLPGTVLAQGSASTAGQITRAATVNTNVLGFAEFDDVINLTASLTTGSLAVGPGTYWIGLHNGDISNISPVQDFYWETTDNNTTTFGVFDDLTNSPSWDTTSQEHAFNISGDLSVATPEPGTVALLAAGIAGLALLKKSGRKA